MQMGRRRSQSTTVRLSAGRRHQFLMDDSLPSQGLHFQTCMANRLTVSEISCLAPDKLPFRSDKHLEVLPFFGVNLVVRLELVCGSTKNKRLQPLSQLKPLEIYARR